MGLGFSDIDHFPSKFRVKELTEVFECVERSQSVQLIGPTGSGKSLMLKAIVESETFKESYFGEKSDNYKFVLVDLKFCIEKNLASIIKFIISKIISGKEEFANEDLNLENIFTKTTKNNSHLTLIFDSFNEIPNPKNLFKILKAVHDQNRGKLSFIFAVNHEVDVNKNFEELVNITSILTENRIFVPPLTENDFYWFLEEQQKYLNKTLSKKEVDNIFRLSGGYMATAKRIIEALKDGEDIKSITASPEKISSISYHFQTLLKDLVEEKETLNNLVNNKISTKDEANMKYLKRSYILNNEAEFIIPLLKTFLINTNSKILINPQEMINDRIMVNAKLTASEFKVLKYLCNKLEKFCDRDEIVENVWGDKSFKGISDHALDQIIYRLRKKIENTDPQLKIETIWGRGHKATLKN